jgi:hypothetical protein
VGTSILRVPSPAALSASSSASSVEDMDASLVGSNSGDFGSMVTTTAPSPKAAYHSSHQQRPQHGNNNQLFDSKEPRGLHWGKKDNNATANGGYHHAPTYGTSPNITTALMHVIPAAALLPPRSGHPLTPPLMASPIDDSHHHSHHHPQQQQQQQQQQPHHPHHRGGKESPSTRASATTGTGAGATNGPPANVSSVHTNVNHNHNKNNNNNSNSNTNSEATNKTASSNTSGSSGNSNNNKQQPPSYAPTIHLSYPTTTSSIRNPLKSSSLTSLYPPSSTAPPYSGVQSAHSSNNHSNTPPQPRSVSIPSSNVSTPSSSANSTPLASPSSAASPRHQTTTTSQAPQQRPRQPSDVGRQSSIDSTGGGGGSNRGSRSGSSSSNSGSRGNHNDEVDADHGDDDDHHHNHVTTTTHSAQRQGTLPSFPFILFFSDELSSELAQALRVVHKHVVEHQHQSQTLL